VSITEKRHLKKRVETRSKKCIQTYDQTSNEGVKTVMRMNFMTIHIYMHIAEEKNRH
jgi:hypothetical protein